MANTSGITPAINAIEVIRIGRNLNRAASSTASKGFKPSSSLARANSTIKMAFFAASPTRTTKPIWVKMLLSLPVTQTPTIADNKAIGAISNTAKGIDQLLY